MVPGAEAFADGCRHRKARHWRYNFMLRVPLYARRAILYAGLFSFIPVVYPSFDIIPGMASNDRLRQELTSFHEVWPGGYYEGDPLDPAGASGYGRLGYLSILHVVYL